MMMGSKPSRKRIQKELETLWVDPPDFCRPGASPVTDILHWEVVIDGPDGSPFVGGTFPIDIDFIGNYPLKPPKITLKTKVRLDPSLLVSMDSTISYILCHPPSGVPPEHQLRRGADAIFLVLTPF